MRRLILLAAPLLAALMIAACGGHHTHLVPSTQVPGRSDTMLDRGQVNPLPRPALMFRPRLERRRRHALKPTAAGKPDVAVDPFVSQVLHSSTGTWTNNPTSFAYQWQRSSDNGTTWSNIAGATTNTYTVVSGDVGFVIRVQVTASNSAGSASQVSAATTTVVGAPLNQSLPTISGAPTQGQALTATTGTWSNSPTSFAYQWLRCDTTGQNCANIGTNSATYTLVSGDVGSTVRVKVTATNQSGSNFATSVQTNTIVSSGGTTFYVDSVSGNDNNNGTSPSTAWASITKVNAQALTAGQSVLFHGGQTFTGELVPATSGSNGSPITYGSFGTGPAILTNPGANNDELNPRGANWNVYQNLILDCQSSSNSSGVFTFSGTASSNLVLDNLEIRNCTYGIQQQRATDANWTIQNSYIHDINESGIVVGGGSHTDNGGGFIIQNNRIENTGTDNPISVGSDAHGIYDDSHGLIVRNNDIGTFQTSAVSIRYHGALVENNTIHDGRRPGGSCCSQGIQYFNYDAADTPAGTFVTTVRRNRIWNQEYGMLIDDGNYGSATLGDPENWRIYNNTFQGGTSGAATAYGIDYRNGVNANGAHSTELRIVNNIFQGSFSSGAYRKGPTTYNPATYQEDYNDWTSSGGVGQGNAGAHDKAVGAQLSAAPNFQPPSSSPVVDAGTATVAGASYTNTCSGGVLDYCGSAPDMGGVEFLSSAGTGPTNTSPPLISGAAQQGQALTTTNGTWSGSPTTFTYQWQTCDAASVCTNVSGATNASYTLASTDINHSTRVAVTASSPTTGSTTAFSATTNVVAPSGGTQTAPVTPVVGNAGTACDKYASPTGLAGNTGAIGSPWDLATLISSLTGGAGSKIGCLEAGTYGTSSSTWTFNNTHSVTFTAQPGVAATLNGWPILNGAGEDVSYLNFDTNKVQAGVRDVSQGCGTTAALYLDIEASNVILEHSNIYESDVATASRNTAIGVAFPGSANYTGAVSGVQIKNNRIHDYGSCKDFDHGIYTDNGSSETITGNWIYNGPFGGGVQIWDQPTSNITVSSNVMDNVGVGLFIGASGSPTTSDTISNNVISNTTGCLYSGTSFCTSAGYSSFWGGTVPSSNTFSNNDLFNVPAGACSNCSGVTVSGTITSDPQYVNSQNQDYRTQAAAVANYGLWNGDASATVSDTALLGKASVGGSQSSGGMGSGLIRAIKYTAGKSGTVRRLSIYLVPGFTAGSQSIACDIYADSTGVPGALLATSAPITFSSTQAAGWYDCALNSPLSVTSSTAYWVAVESGTTSGVAGFRWDSVGGSRLFQNDTFGSPPNPFGTANATDDEQMSFYAIVQ